MAQIIRYVDPDVAAGDSSGDSWINAYASLNAWEAAEEVDLDAANNYMTVYCRSSGGTADTANCDITGWTTSVADYIEIIGTDFPAEGVWDDTAYRMERTNPIEESCITVRESHVDFHNLQFKMTTSGAANGFGLILHTGTVYSKVDSCIFRGVCSGTGFASGLQINSATFSTDIYNCVIYGFVSGADADHSGIWWANTAGGSSCNNTTIYGCYRGHAAGIDQGGALYNNAIGNCTDDIFQIGSVDHCCTDDDDGSDSQGPLDGNWANEFTTPGSDFHLLVGGNCVGNGVDDPGSGKYSDDIRGLTRTSIWDIGAFEYGSLQDPPIWIHHYQQIGGL